MARQIDERIVQMTFNNQNFENNAKQTISTLDKLKNALNFGKTQEAFTDLNKTINGFDLSALNAGVSKISDGFSALETIAFGALTRIGSQAIDTGIKLAKSLSIDQLGEGWQKYTEQTQSVQTLVNSTGKSVNEIDKYLEKLMWYSDETSFGFTDMTSALATMVSSGGDLDSLIPTIMGIGNATAYAGKGASEFKRVIYNLNQSYSSGFLNTMDWRSIELAGVDSKALKEQLIGAAEALGTIKKGVYGLNDFKKLLSDKVFTRGVMEKAFGNFAELTLEAQKLVEEGKFELAADAIDYLSGKYNQIAENSFKAAQEAKSFTEAIDATKDAVSSGWMQSFKLIFGNYTESKALWTDVTETFWEIFASGAEGRNSILKTWKELWTEEVRVIEALSKRNVSVDDLGYEPLVEVGDALTQTQALWKAFSDTILKIKTDIAEVWETVFPTDIEKTARTIFDVIESIRLALADFAHRGDWFAPYQGLLSVLEGVFKAFKLIIDIAKEFNNSFIKPLVEKIKPIISDVSKIFGNIGDVVAHLSGNLSNDMAPVQKIFQSILTILNPLIDGIAKVVKWFRELSDEWRNSKLDENADNMNLFGKALEFVGSVLSFISGVVNGTINAFSELSKILTTVFGKLSGTVGNFLESNSSNIGGLAAGGFFGALGYGIINLTKLIKEFKLEDILKKFSPLEKVKEIIKEVQDTLVNFTNSEIKTSVFIDIGKALLMLAGSLFIISLIDSEKLVIALTGLAFVLYEVVKTMEAINKIDVNKNFKKTAKVFGGIAVSIIFLAGALKILSTIQPKEMIVSVLALGAVLVGLGVFINQLAKIDKKTNPKLIKSIGQTMKNIGLGMIAIAAALKIMSTIDGDSMGRALLAFAATLGAVGVLILAIGNFSKQLSGAKLLAIGAAMVGIGLGLIAIAAALKIMSTIDAEGMDAAMLGIWGSLLAIGALVLLLSATKVGAATFLAFSVGMLALSAAIIAISGALVMLGKVGWKTIGPGLGMLVAAIWSLAASGALLGFLSPLIMLLSLSILAFGAALKMASSGIMAFVGAYTIFEALGGRISKALMKIFEEAVASVISLIPSIFLGIGKAVLNIAGELVTLIGQLFDILILAVNNSLPKLIELGVSILKFLLDGIGKNIADVATLVATIITELLKAFGDNMPRILEELVVLVIKIINGLAETIRAHAGEIGTAFGNLAAALVEGLISGIGGVLGGFASNLWEAGKDAWSGIVSFFSGGEAEQGNKDAGSKVLEDVETGLEQQEPKLLDTVDEIGTNVTDELNREEDAKESGGFTAQGFIDSLEEYVPMVFDAGFSLGSAAIDGINSGAGVASPSKLAAKAGKFVIQGLANGLNNNNSIAEEAGFNSGSSVISAIQEAINAANSIMDDDLNPVITPVLDLSNIQNGAGSINGLFGQTSLNGAMSIGGYSRLNQNEANKPEINIEINVSNNGRDLTEQDLTAWSNQIVRKVNVELGKLLT